MERLRILTFISLLLSALVFCLKNRTPSTQPAGERLVVNKSWLVLNAHSVTPVKDQRPPDQTFLTYPEWFLVFSPAEQAKYFEQHTSTTFPYLKHVDQLWKGYQVVYHQIRGNYPFNTGYHVMIMVIAGSTTAEYGLKAGYETVIGRITESGGALSDEDKFMQQYMAGYVRFIEETPWYEYDFNAQLKKLWSDTPFFGDHLLRKLERRYFLTTELLIKSGYGWLIKQGTKASYEPALLNTAVVVDRLPASIPAEMKAIRRLPNGWYLANLPRYAPFNAAAAQLASQNVNFKEVAGNTSAIMLTVLTSRPLAPATGYQTVFTQPIVTQPGLNRVALVTPVQNLSPVINQMKAAGARIEHIYDF